MRKAAIILGLILIVFASARILLDTSYADDIRVHRLFARFLIGSERRLLMSADSMRATATPESLKEAIEIYREILARDPVDPYRWCDLGSALFASGRPDLARNCYRRAAELGPNNIQTLWRVADFYKRIKEPREALRWTSHILKKAPDSDQAIFYSYTQGEFDFADTLNLGLPEEKSVAQAYLRYLFQFGGAQRTEQCWNWIAARSFADDKLAGDYAAFLLRIGENRKARDLWAGQLGERRGSYLKSNFLYNGGFESEPGKSPFDWNISKSSGAEVTRDPDVRRSGNWSLRIDFGGKENISFRSVFQTVFLEPGTYRFKGFLRTEGITTDRGVGFRIVQIAPPGQTDVRTDEIVGTRDWTGLEKSLILQAPGLVRIEIFREPSWKFDNKLAGTAWLDDLEISR